MLSHHEERSANHIIVRRAIHFGYVGTWEESPLSTCPTCLDYPHGSGWRSESNNFSGIGHIETNRATLATAFPGFATGGAGKGRAPSRSHSQNPDGESPKSRRSDSPYHPSQCNPLEHTEHGRGSRGKRSHDTPYLEAAQSKTSFSQDLQGQPRQTFRRKTARRCWSLPQSSRQIPGAVCRREESDSSSRPDSAGFTDEKGSLWDDDSRLQTKRHNNLICSSQHARRYDYRRLSATTSASRIYPLPQENRRRDSDRSQSALDRRQLWNAQASQSNSLAQATFTISIALYPDFKLLVEHGRAVVPRDHRQAHPPWLVPKSASIDRGYQKIYREPQPKSTGVCMDSTRGTDSVQSSQK